MDMGRDVGMCHLQRGKNLLGVKNILDGNYLVKQLERPWEGLSSVGFGIEWRVFIIIRGFGNVGDSVIFLDNLSKIFLSPAKAAIRSSRESLAAKGAKR